MLGYNFRGLKAVYDVRKLESTQGSEMVHTISLNFHFIFPLTLIAYKKDSGFALHLGIWVTNYRFNKSHLRPPPGKRTSLPSPTMQAGSPPALDLDLSESCQCCVQSNLLQVNYHWDYRTIRHGLMAFSEVHVNAVLLNTDQTMLKNILHNIISLQLQMQLDVL